MRKIEQQMLEAIKNKQNWKLSNTEVCVDEDTTIVKLHGNTIAKITSTSLFLSDATWRTRTTKSRLNSIRNLYHLPNFYQKDYVWYTGEESNYSSEEEWSGFKTYFLNTELKCS